MQKLQCGCTQSCSIAHSTGQFEKGPTLELQLCTELVGGFYFIQGQQKHHRKGLSLIVIIHLPSQCQPNSCSCLSFSGLSHPSIHLCSALCGIHSGLLLQGKTFWSLATRTIIQLEQNSDASSTTRIPVAVPHYSWKVFGGLQWYTDATIHNSISLSLLLFKNQLAVINSWNCLEKVTYGSLSQGLYGQDNHIQNMKYKQHFFAHGTSSSC